jgi:2-polyprenyl-6-hydroxyphenyl methylase/3-demethylubiquinone-9 3-methyltransferase
MWRACQVVSDAVSPGGLLAIAIYNDQGLASRVWTKVKQSYVEGSEARRRALLVACGAYFSSRDAVGRLLSRRPAPKRPRGMDRRHDLVDWVGGYPFEVAKPEEVFDFFRDRGYTLEGLTTCRGGLGCNEFLLRKGTRAA